MKKRTPTTAPAAAVQQVANTSRHHGRTGPSLSPDRGLARPRTRRAALCVAGLVTVALGLGIRTFSDGTWTGPAGDALYAVLVYVLVALLVPRKPKTLIAAAAVTACAVIELFQLTGLPAELGQSWPPIRLVLGTTFGAADLLAYAGGSALAYAADRTMGTVAKSR